MIDWKTVKRVAERAEHRYATQAYLFCLIAGALGVVHLCYSFNWS